MKNNGKMLTVNYQEIPLAKVFESFAKGFVPPEGKKVNRYETFVDTDKGVVLFKLYIEEPDEDRKLIVVPELQP